MADGEILRLIDELGRPSPSQRAGGLFLLMHRIVMMRSRARLLAGAAWIGLRPTFNGPPKQRSKGIEAGRANARISRFRPLQGRAVHRHRPNKQKSRPAGWIQVGAGHDEGPSIAAALARLLLLLLLTSPHALAPTAVSFFGWCASVAAAAAASASEHMRSCNAHDGCVMEAGCVRGLNC